MKNRSKGRKALLIGASFCTLIGSSINLWAATEPPPRCTGHGNLQSISFTDWETGLGSWTAGTHDIADTGSFATPDWAAVGSLPDNQPGNAAFVANLDIGDCGADDQAGVLALDSPSITIPGNAAVPRISIEQWFETEFGWDGGNIKISVNGGPFNIIPASAFEYGPHNDTLFPAQDEFGVENNTNPLAGQDAFTGTINDNLSGSWIQSRINLLGIAAAGDNIELRFDFGIDSCDGAVGWYVDDVEVYSCAAELPPSDCGNGVIDAGEQCDDGNDFIGDGCSNTCQIENGWQCAAPTQPGNIADPSFEAGTPNPFWAEISNNPISTPICEIAVCGKSGGTGPADGTYWVFLGGITSFQEGSVSQSVVIPSAVTELTFDFEAASCDSASDYVEVLIDGAQELLIDGSSPLCGNVGYTRQSVDISAYADGGTHDLEFHSETFSNNGGVSNFFLDVIAMPGSPSACTPADPSLTLVKKVINNNGGSAIPANWTLTATGPTGFSGNGPRVSSEAGFESGSYDLSESGGPGGYSASEWVCDGGSQDDADTITLAQGESATCTITNDDIGPAIQINAGHAGAWFNPETSGQGQFIDVVPEEQFMFISWFTFTDAASGNPNEQHWYTAQGNYSGSTANLVLFETLGGKFDDPQAVTTTQVGEVTLSFNDCSQGQMAYSFDEEDLQRTVPLIRVIPGSENVCEQLNGNTTQAVDINSGMDGAWFDPNTSGQGYFIDAYPNTEGGNFIFVSWFTYGEETASGQRWLTAQGGFEGSVAEIDVFETTGGSFDDPKPVNTAKVGTMSLDFTDCSNALLTYSLPAESAEGDIAITRVIPAGKALCEELAGAE
jgi:cysteine-rich repeat protein